MHFKAVAIYYQSAAVLLVVSFMPKLGCKFHKLLDVFSHPVCAIVGSFVNECAHVYMSINDQHILDTYLFMQFFLV